MMIKANRLDHELLLSRSYTREMKDCWQLDKSELGNLAIHAYKLTPRLEHILVYLEHDTT